MPRHPGQSSATEGLSAAVFSQLLAQARAAGRTFYPLHVGDTYLDPIPAARAENQRTAEVPQLHAYGPPHGDDVLLEAISEHLARTGPPGPPREDIQVMAGATSGLSIVARTLLEPEDEVLLPAPFWPLIRGIVSSRGAVPVQIPFFTRLEDPAFEPERTLEEAVTSKTAAIYVNTPHNPTGRILGERELQAIARVSARHDLWVLTDETYEGLAFTETPPAPVWARDDLRPRVIATHTLSKSHALAGARVGFTHGPPEVMRSIRSLQTYQTYCAARPMQRAAASALREGRSWLEQVRQTYRQAGRRAAEALGLPAPEGGTFLFFDAAPYFRAGEDILGFLSRCLEAGVLLTPGSACGRDYPTWARLCFTAVPPDDLDDALRRLQPILNP